MSKALHIRKLFIFGFRSFPNVPGGIEEHVRNLTIRYDDELKNHMMLLARSNYVNEDTSEYATKNFLEFRPIYAPTSKNFEAIVHAFCCLVYCIIRRPSIVHLHSVTNGWITPFLRIFGIKVVFTHHGRDYLRDKWPAPAKKFLKISELLALKSANAVIFVSKTDFKEFNTKCSLAYHIPNGVQAQIQDQRLDTSFECVSISRLVPEKRIHRLAKICSTNQITVNVVGSGSNSYLKTCLNAGDTRFVHFSGELHGAHKFAALSSAEVFVSFSNLEGFPISVLEALSLGMRVLLSDIPAHRELGLDDIHYFDVDDEDDFLEKLHIVKKIAPPIINLQQYDWDTITSQTLGVYNDLSGL